MLQYYIFPVTLPFQQHKCRTTEEGPKVPAAYRSLKTKRKVGRPRKKMITVTEETIKERKTVQLKPTARQLKVQVSYPRSSEFIFHADLVSTTLLICVIILNNSDFFSLTFITPRVAGSLENWLIYSLKITLSSIMQHLFVVCTSQHVREITRVPAEYM